MILRVPTPPARSLGEGVATVDQCVTKLTNAAMRHENTRLLSALNQAADQEPELLAEWNWSEHFAGQAETEAYLNFVVDKLGLRDVHGRRDWQGRQAYSIRAGGDRPRDGICGRGRRRDAQAVAAPSAGLTAAKRWLAFLNHVIRAMMPMSWPRKWCCGSCGATLPAL